MKYVFSLIVCSMLSACGGGGESNADISEESLGNGTYSGSGIGVWRYDNTSGAAATVNINIDGVSAGQVATLVFSNGSQSDAASQPSLGMASFDLSSAALADAGTFAGAASAHHDDDDAHARMLEKNREASAALMRERLPLGPAGELASQPLADSLSFPPAVGTTRSWTDNFVSPPVSYNASVQAVCTLPSGRSVVWWVDPGVVSSGTFSASAWSSALGKLQASYCGSSGGLAQINKLLGDVWGGAAAGYANTILDTPVLQDINVVVLNVPSSSQWAGYFFGSDTKRKASYASSNEALAFFINASQIKADLNFATSTLMHESTHMVNFYQRSVVKGVTHDTWLEETSAMMTEDIVAPSVLGGYNKVMSYRLPIYLASGGNVSYINWPTLSSSSSHYAMGGGFGAFLNRRYGLAIYQQLVTSCRDGVAGSPALTSHACLDGLIKANGGSGFGDEFARFGASVFARLPATGLPSGYGYPATTAGGYALQAQDLSSFTLAAPAALTSGYKATSQTFRRDVVAEGKTTYTRSGVVVPANTSLTLTIQ